MPEVKTQRTIKFNNDEIAEAMKLYSRKKRFFKKDVEDKDIKVELKNSDGSDIEVTATVEG